MGDAAAQLHEAVLPDGLPVLPRVDVAATYLLPDDADGVGGDWFDVTPTPSGALALVVGDVVGKGIDAVLTATQLRAVLRERLRAGAGVQQALMAVDAVAADLAAGHGTTVCVALLDGDTGRFEYATAGHPPPLVVDPDAGARFLDPTGGSLLGAGGSQPTGEGVLASGELLLLYTDGTVERPSRTTSQNTLDLAALAGEAFRSIGGGHGVRGTVDAVCERLLGDLVEHTGFSDDMVLLAAERMPSPYVVDLRLPAVPATLRASRAALWDWLVDLHAGDLDVVTLLHAVGELVSNAVEHAYADVPDPGDDAIGIHAQVDLDGTVVVAVVDRGGWRSGSSPGRGRGLFLAGGLVDDVQLETGSAGTRVTVRHRVGRPVQIYRNEAGSQPRRAEPETFRTSDAGPGRVAVHGAVDHLTADSLRDDLLLRGRGGTRELVVDLSGVSFLGSAGVQVLAETLSWAGLVAETGSTAQHVLETVGLPYGRP
jgi:anti-sigma regulatory factor (Ser/Thr protein kinase)